MTVPANQKRRKKTCNLGLAGFNIGLVSQTRIGSNLAAIVLVGSKLVEAAQTSNTGYSIAGFPAFSGELFAVTSF